MLKTAHDSQLIGIVQKGDVVEIASASYTATGAMKECFGGDWYYAYAPVTGGATVVFSRGIEAVYRNGVEIWRRGNAPKQLAMFE